MSVKQSMCVLCALGFLSASSVIGGENAPSTKSTPRGGSERIGGPNAPSAESKSKSDPKGQQWVFCPDGTKALTAAKCPPRTKVDPPPKDDGGPLPPTPSKK